MSNYSVPEGRPTSSQPRVSRTLPPNTAFLSSRPTRFSSSTRKTLKRTKCAAPLRRAIRSRIREGAETLRKSSTLRAKTKCASSSRTFRLRSSTPLKSQSAAIWTASFPSLSSRFFRRPTACRLTITSTSSPRKAFRSALSSFIRTPRFWKRSARHTTSVSNTNSASSRA